MKHEDQIEEILFGAISPECRSEIESARATFALLAHAAQPVRPPEHLRARILESIKSQTAQTQQTADVSKETPRLREARGAPLPGAVVLSREMWRFGLVAASVVLIALLASLAGLLAQNSQRDSLRAERDQTRAQLDQARSELAREREVTALLTGERSRIHTLAGTSVAPRADGRVAYDQNTGQVAIFVHDLPPAPAGRAYQLWYLTPDARKIPGGVFSTDGAGGAVVFERVPGNERANIIGFAITIEPQTGSQFPTGEIYLVTPPPASS
jgi:anti-sigma-K factor RskA